MLVLVGVGSAAWVAYGDAPGWVAVLPANLAPFALGMLLAVASAFLARPGHRFSRIDALGRHPVLWWLVAGLAWSATVWWLDLRSVLTAGVGTTGNQIFGENMLRTVVGIAIVLPAVLGDQRRGAIRRTLRWRPLVFVGLVSYGIYLWHVPLITWMERQAGRASADTNFLVLTAATITAAIVVATVSWYVVEKPIVSLSRRRRLLGRRPGAGA